MTGSEIALAAAATVGASILAARYGARSVVEEAKRQWGGIVRTHREHLETLDDEVAHQGHWLRELSDHLKFQPPPRKRPMTLEQRLSLHASADPTGEQNATGT